MAKLSARSLRTSVWLWTLGPTLVAGGCLQQRSPEVGGVHQAEAPRAAAGAEKAPSRCAGVQPGKTWIVDGDAPDQGDGSKDKPFRSIQAAAAVAKAGDTVLIHGGTYRETVTPAHDGADCRWVTFKPASDEAVIVSGADLVLGEWKPSPVAEGAYQTELKTGFDSQLNQAEQLFVNGRMMVEARYPNVPFHSLDPMRAPVLSIDGLEVIGNTPDKPESHGWKRMRFIDAELDAKAGTWDGATIWFRPRHGGGHMGGGWGHRMSGKVVKQQKGELVVDLPVGKNGPTEVKAPFGEPYYLGQLLTALDGPGEWLHDGDQLYLLPVDGSDPNERNVEIKRRDYAFDLSERSYIAIEGLEVFAATITTDTKSGGQGAGGGAHATYRGRNDIAPSSHVLLDGLHFRYVNHFTDMSAWTQGQWIQTSGIVLSGRNHTIQNSIVEYSAGNGILAIGENHLVDNNLVHDTNYVGTFAAGICMGMESPNRDVIIRRNSVWATGFDGIMTQKLRSSDPKDPARVHHNFVSAFGLMTRDVGGIKVVGHDDANGTRWDHNLVRDGDAWAMGIYWDFATGWAADHNVAWDMDMAMNLNEGKKHQVYNNVLLGRRGSMGSTKSLEKVDIQNNILSDKEVLPNRGGTVSHNIEASMSLFKDPANGDFRLRKGATKAIDKGASIPEPYATEKIHGEAPDIGAYEFGTEAWEAGSSLKHPTAAPTGLRATRLSNSSVKLQWKDVADNERYYYIERSNLIPGHRGWLSFEVVAEVPANATEYIDDSAGARWGTVYYRVRADNSVHSNTAVLTPATVGAHWSFDGKLVDVAPKNSFRDRGAYYAAGAERAANFGAARLGSASLKLNKAQNTVVEVPNGVDLNPREEMTLLAWVHPKAPGSKAVVFQKKSNGNGYALRLDGDGVVLELGQESLKLPELPPNEWTLVAVVYKQKLEEPWKREANVLVYYADADNDLEGLIRTAIKDQELSSGAPLYFGAPSKQPSSPATVFDGLVDEVQIYHVALSEEQLEQAMRGKIPSGL